MGFSKTFRVIACTLTGAVLPLILAFLPIVALFLIGNEGKQVPSQEWIFLGFLALGSVILGAVIGLLIGAADLGFAASALAGFSAGLIGGGLVAALIIFGACAANMELVAELWIGIAAMVTLLCGAGLATGLVCALLVRLTLPKMQPASYQNPPIPPTFR